MGRLLILACLLVLALGAAPAFAQDPAPGATPTPVADEDQPADDGDDVLDADEVPPESTPDPSDDENCVPGPSADGDYTSCACPEPVAGADGEYVYCAEGSAGGAPPPLDAGPVTPAPEVSPAHAEVRPVAAGTLP